MELCRCKNAPASIAVVGPEADLIFALEGNYNGIPHHPVEPVDGIAAQFSKLADSLRARLNAGRGRQSSGSAHCLQWRRTQEEFFATPDWTGRPVATGTDHDIQAEWGDSLPVPEVRTHVYSVRWSGKLAVPAAGHYTFSVEPADAFPYSPKDSFRLTLDGKVVSEGELRKKIDLSCNGQLQIRSGS
jgi:beta-glucosidase